MIWLYFLTFITTFLDAVFFWLPKVDSLPLGMDSALSTAFGYFHYVLDFIPPLQTAFTAFLWYAVFEISLLTLRLLRIIR